MLDQVIQNGYFPVKYNVETVPRYSVEGRFLETNVRVLVDSRKSAVVLLISGRLWAVLSDLRVEQKYHLCPWVKKMIETHCETRFFRKECVLQDFFSHRQRFTAVIL